MSFYGFQNAFFLLCLSLSLYQPFLTPLASISMRFHLSGCFELSGGYFSISGFFAVVVVHVRMCVCCCWRYMSDIVLSLVAEELNASAIGFYEDLQFECLKTSL